MTTADTMTYRYAAGLSLLVNVLATAALAVSIDVVGHVHPVVLAGTVCNLFAYPILISSIRSSVEAAAPNSGE